MQNFPDDFKWGAATAAYQIEGGVREDGRGESIWDRFTHTPGVVSDGSNGDVACDHYHLWQQDVGLMQTLGLNAHRFSIAWPRIFPDGRGTVNRRGLDFYSRLVDGLLTAGIEPAVTLYHWDLPQALEDRGGWVNRDTADYFTDYVNAVFTALSDRVGMWITLNEPWVVSMLGYGTGDHAPGLTDFGKAIRVSHVLNLAHAKAVRLFQSDFTETGRIGITLNLSPADPETDEDRDAALVADGFMNRWFLDPPLRGSYPTDMTELYAGLGWDPGIQDGDMDLIAGATADFLGVNYYMRQLVRRSVSNKLGYETAIPDDAQTTEMGWEVCPGGLHTLLTRLHEDYDAPVLYITENGAAFPDTEVLDDVVQDSDRIDYLNSHLSEAWRAIQDGVDLRGYYLWSLMDNFEWAYGFSKRFGIVRTDYDSLERTIKASGVWYRDVIARGGLEG